jgi:hypothetical protein
VNKAKLALHRRQANETQETSLSTVSKHDNNINYFISCLAALKSFLHVLCCNCVRLNHKSNSYYFNGDVYLQCKSVDLTSSNDANNDCCCGDCHKCINFIESDTGFDIQKISTRHNDLNAPLCSYPSFMSRTPSRCYFQETDQV